MRPWIAVSPPPPSARIMEKWTDEEKKEAVELVRAHGCTRGMQLWNASHTHKPLNKTNAHRFGQEAAERAKKRSREIAGGFGDSPPAKKAVGRPGSLSAQENEHLRTAIKEQRSRGAPLDYASVSDLARSVVTISGRSILDDDFGYEWARKWCLQGTAKICEEHLVPAEDAELRSDFTPAGTRALWQPPHPPPRDQQRAIPLAG
eukprot:TRINITY_DN2352_c0_g3_i1.p1 TRINITY_DN2352_c0_g3~~TRINITY_DN2352_c0_g3_i1.p1  ORF type:complete len:204 (+),score=23.62 TRINITY_DN2352_c0_g3_i1:180-791(+)